MVEFYQGLKPIIQNFSGLAKDAIHIYIGVGTFLVAWFFYKKPKAFILLFPIGISILMELLDMAADWERLGRFLWMAYIHDLVNTNAIPVLLYFFINLKRISRESFHS